eukprot:1774038-Amphidinium_carterae.1
MSSAISVKCRKDGCADPHTCRRKRSNISSACRLANPKSDQTTSQIESMELARHRTLKDGKI